MKTARDTRDLFGFLIQTSQYLSTTRALSSCAETWMATLPRMTEVIGPESPGLLSGVLKEREKIEEEPLVVG
jgi:hypothetical protein